MFIDWFGGRRQECTGRRVVLRVEGLEAREVPAIVPVYGEYELFGDMVPRTPTTAAVSTAASAGIDPNLINRIRAIAAVGRTQGNRLDVVMKIGDSNTSNFAFLDPMGRPGYNPNDARNGVVTQYAETVEFFTRRTVDGSGANSFTRQSTSARGGWRTQEVLNALGGELNSIKPGVAIIMLGTNDVGYRNPEIFRSNLTTIVNTLIARGVVPILSTIPDRLANNSAYQSTAMLYNQVIRQVAAQAQVPLMDYWSALQSLPGKGLSVDQVHPSHSPLGPGDLTAEGLRYGFNMRNLLALHTLQGYRAALGV